MSSSEYNPYSDDGECGSDKDFEPNDSDISSEFEIFNRRPPKKSRKISFSSSRPSSTEMGADRPPSKKSRRISFSSSGSSNTEMDADLQSEVNNSIAGGGSISQNKRYERPDNIVCLNVVLDEPVAMGSSPFKEIRDFVLSEEPVDISLRAISPTITIEEQNLPVDIDLVSGSLNTVTRCSPPTLSDQPGPSTLSTSPTVDAAHLSSTTPVEVISGPEPPTSSTAPSANVDGWFQSTEPIPVFHFDYSSEGLRVGISENPTELDVFKLLFPDEILDSLVSCTNAYGSNMTYKDRPHPKHSRKQEFKSVTKDEMLIFLGLCLLNGQVKVPKRRSLFSYSNPLYYHPFFSYIMSGRRFEKILRCLYVADIGAKGEKKIIHFIDALTENFRKIHGPQKQLVIDESLILFRGRLHFRQYIKSKKARYGIKFYELTSSDGYVLNMIMYCGKDESDDGSTKKTEQIVMKLLQPCLVKGHHVFMDKFYNDVELSQKLLAFRTHTCGTLKKDRKSNPKVLTSATLEKGDYYWRRKGNVYVSAWKDKRTVYIVTTRNHPKMQIVANRFGKLSLKPEEIADYNQYMGGIDRADQMVSYYSSPQKTIRWYKYKVFFHMLDIAVWNAFYLYKKFFKAKPNNNYGFLDFRDALVKQMTKVDNTLKGRDVIRAGSIYSSRRTDAAKKELESSKQISQGHWPEDIPRFENAQRKFKYLNCA